MLIVVMMGRGRGELGFLNCDDICICVVNKQFELLEFVFESVYVDLQFISLLLLGLCACVVCVVLWYSLVCLWDCRGTLCCGCGCCGDCDACTVVCVARVFAARLLGCEGDGNAGVGSGGGVVVMSAYMGGTCGSGVLFSAGDVLEMSVARAGWEVLGASG